MLASLAGQPLLAAGSSTRHTHARCHGTSVRVFSIRAAQEPFREGPRVPRALSLRSRCAGSPGGPAARRAVATAAWFNQQSAEAKIEQTAQLTQEDDVLETLQLAPDVRERVTQAVEDLGGTVRRYVLNSLSLTLRAWRCPAWFV